MGPIRTLTLAGALILGTAPIGRAQDHLEMAARINVAENICDVDFGRGLLHHVMLAAHERQITVEDAARLADRRHAEIVAWLNRNSKLDAFCRNARAGKL